MGQVDSCLRTAVEERGLVVDEGVWEREVASRSLLLYSRSVSSMSLNPAGGAFLPRRERTGGMLETRPDVIRNAGVIVEVGMVCMVVRVARGRKCVKSCVVSRQDRAVERVVGDRQGRWFWSV
jgi:hypothetical protein